MATYTLGVQNSYLYTPLTNGASFSGATVVGGDTIELAVGDQKRGIVLGGYLGEPGNHIIIEGNGQALDATGLPNTLISWGNDCGYITFRNFTYINITGSVPAMAGRSGSFIFEGLRSGAGATGAQYGIGLKNYPDEGDIGSKYRSDFPPDGFANDLIIMRDCHFNGLTNEGVYFGTSHLQDVFVDGDDKTILTEEPMVDRLLIEDCTISNTALDGYQAQANNVILRRCSIVNHGTANSPSHKNGAQFAGIGKTVFYDCFIDAGGLGGHGVLSRNDDFLMFNCVLINVSIGFWNQLGVNFPNGGGYKIIHNTFVNVSDECILVYNTIARNNKLWNNIMHLTAANVKGYYVEGTAGQDLNMDRSNNLEIQGAQALLDTFTNAALGDYRLKSTASNAIGKARKVSHIDSRLRIDAGGELRGLDIGAFGIGIHAFTDEFNEVSLDAKWTITDPVGDATITTLGGQLSIELPSGSLRDAWESGNTTTRITESATDTNFEIITKFDNEILTNNAYGLLIEETTSKYIRFDFYTIGNPSKLVFAAVLDGATSDIKVNTGITVGSPLWLKVNRTGNVWTQSYSTDGEIWTQAVQFIYTMVVNNVGIYAGTPDSTGTQIMLVDYFRYADVAEIVKPVLTSALDINTGATTGGGSVTTDIGNGDLDWVLTQSATTPTKPQIIAGLDHLGAAGDDNGTKVISAVGIQPVSFTGLTDGLTYYLHSVHTDSSAQQSNAISGDGFTTSAIVGYNSGNAIRMNGTNMNIDFTGNSMTMSTTAWTMGLWVKPNTGYAGGEALFGLNGVGSNTQLEFWSSGDQIQYVNGGTPVNINTPSTISVANGWKLVVITMVSDGQLRVNVDGVAGPDGTVSVDTGGFEWDKIGRKEIGSNFLHADLDDIVVWDGVALSDAQCLSWFNSGNGADPSTIEASPTRHFKADSVSGNTMVDDGSLGVNGTVQNISDPASWVPGFTT